MSYMRLLGFGITAGLLASACGDPERSTDLHPEGAPEVLQVFMNEKVQVGNTVRVLKQLAFGDHPSIDEDDDDRVVTTAVARGNQQIRIVVDELLVGNYLEEIACADGSFSSIPVGATPDDISNCAGGLDFITANCTGDNAVCVGNSGPIGILDENEDGAPDNLRMIDGAVAIVCDGVVVPHDIEQSFWQPSGNQLITAGPLGLDSLGPAIVLVPSSGLRTGGNCTIEFDESVVDKSGVRVCAPEGGVAGAACTPGDTTEISFGVEPLVKTGSSPANAATNVALDASLLIQFNAGIDPASLGGIAIEEVGGAGILTTCDDGTPSTPCYDISVGTNDNSLITVEVGNDGDWTAGSTYEVTITSGATGITDIFGGELGADELITFTTAN